MINPKDKVIKDFEDLSRKRNELISNYNGTFYIPLYEETLSSDETEVEKQKNFLKILNKVPQIMN
ncbi:hypothetical protein ATZ36_00365 [Candidatus Endomicrobiellum trichonymphae]|uniref:Uncharacterized protein n=1 Tax=Endomicrobium trichonymphae TaxID=1408204 RepID=A0A1E5IHD0_ENDTX|nr:hypothetical protein ATZ36_08535 [Candidatus Endomicrobium trichonymphae]OEG69870.1 hypothetical protein ATZ36_00365 [Candidatus Endomicrobium trichonymphae]